MIRFTEKDQEQLNKLSQGLRKNTRLDSGASIAAYQKKYANSGKMFKGKWRRWDSRTKTWYDPKLVTAYLNKQEYGTTTPKEDLKYLKALKSQTIKESGVQYNDPARINLSRKLVIDETNPYGTVYEKEQAARRNKDRVELTKIRRKSSYGEERDFGPNYKEKEESLFIAAGDEAQLPGSDANEALKIENRNAKGRVLSPKLQAGDAVVSRNNDKRPKTNREKLRSDVFTLDADGNALGVMTRSQRRAWDSANQATMQLNIDKKKAYENRTWDGWIGSG